VIVRLLPILGITFIDILGFSILLPLMPYYVQHFGAPVVVVGLLFSTFAICQFVAGPIWGHVSDRIGRKMVLVVSQIGATVGWTMLAFAPTIGWVFVARIVEGVSGGNISVTQAYVADLVAPEQRARAFSYVGAAFSAGIVFGPAFGGLLVGRYGYTAPFLAAAGLQLLTLVLTLVMLPESRTKEEQQDTAGFGDIVRSLGDKKLSPVLVQKLIWSLGLYGWFAAFTLILQRQLGLNESTASYFFAGFGVISIVIQIGVVGRITDALGDRRASNLGLVAGLIAFGIVPFIHDIYTGFVMLVFFAFALSINNATLAALMTDAAPENQRGTILGVGSSLDSASGIVMPTISTGALEWYGVAATAGISGLFTLGALALGLTQTKSAPIDAVAVEAEA
jgi:DHA1 family tetracycline resistance protein-like MFS transporter